VHPGSHLSSEHLKYGIADPKMVSTQLSCIASSDAETSHGVNSSDAVNGKRKSRSVGSGKGDDQSIKRRKRESSDREKLNVISNGHLVDEAASAGQQQSHTAHIRFGSEDLILPGNTVLKERPGVPQTIREIDGESGDEAPESFDNSSQLQKMKAESQKQDDVKKRFVANVDSSGLKLTVDPRAELLKKEKRRQLDERHKFQANSTSKKLKHNSAGVRSSENNTAHDDSVSESTATLQGSIPKENGRSPLPTLLPDEILNAVPAARPPTPPPETSEPKQTSKKLKFLDNAVKPPRDLHLGGVTIRVLDEGSSGTQTSSALPPKVSKPGRNIREAWMAGKRNKGNSNSLRRSQTGSWQTIKFCSHLMKGQARNL
jgi:U3 small nucleolar RNA-associated protein 16